MATPHYVGRRDIGHPFQAKYRGTCAGCDLTFLPGDLVVFIQDELFVADHECPTQPAQMDDKEPMHHRVMPRGATPSQACSRCFQIPSSNGICGCM